MKRIKRARVDELIAEALDRVRAINDDFLWPELIYEVRLFGSCLQEQDDYGDIDIAIDMKNVFCGKGSTDDFVKIMRRHHDLHYRGRTRYTLIDVMFWHGLETFRRVKNRRHHISVHCMSELKSLNCLSRKIYPTEETACKVVSYEPI